MPRALVTVRTDATPPHEHYVLRILDVFCAASKGIPGIVSLPPDLMAGLDVRLRRMLERLALGHSVTNLGDGIGNWEADTVLVGDKSSGHYGVDWPFVSVILTGAAGWLTKYLEQSGVSEQELYWLNAYSCNGEPRDASGVRKFRHVIALGRRASEWCAANGLEHSQVHNPTYWKKHYPTKPYILSKLIRQGGKK